jgi:predicted nucleic acid-binding protein
VSPLGRRPLQRGVFSFEDQEIAIPERVVVDTSFVLEALLVSQPLHAPCQKFLIELASAGSALFFSRLLDVELAEAAFQLALKERHPKDWRRFRHDGRARPRAAKLMRDVAGAWEDVLDAVPFRRVEVGAVAHRVPGLMGSYGLASYDAVHAATAIETGVRRMITIDAGFGAIPESELALLVDSSRVASCRRRRR